MINVNCAKSFCKEDISKIENYDKAVNDNLQTWHCHHRTEIWWNCSKQELLDNDCYYNRKACELIFLTPTEHLRLHNMGKSLSAETRRKISKRVISKETRRKMADGQKGKSKPWAAKVGKAYTGMTWKLIDGKRVWLPKE